MGPSSHDMNKLKQYNSTITSHRFSLASNFLVASLDIVLIIIYLFHHVNTKLDLFHIEVITCLVVMI